MGDQEAVWAVHLGADGAQLGRTALKDGARDALPLREMITAGLQADAAAMIVVRQAANADCAATAEDLGAIQRAREILLPLRLQLHDYVLFWGDRCVSLRLAGRL